MSQDLLQKNRIEDEANYLYALSNKYDSMSKAEKIIADCLLTDKMLFVSCSITLLARKLKVSPASITRFCQKLNYSGFSELKYNIANNALVPLEKEEKLSTKDSVGNIINKLIYLNQTAILDSLIHLNQDLINAAAKAICSAKTVHIYAEGGPGSTANYTYQLFLKIGIPCNHFTDTQLAMIAAMQLKPKDVVICISRTGQSQNMMRAVNLAKTGKVTIIGITASTESNLVDLSDILIRYSSRIENDLRYLHIARICELSVVGVLFTAIVNLVPEQIAQNASNSAKALNMNQKDA